jgi:hypothetical protein
MRSQLDCHDRRLPGTGVFDIKTRAVLPIRLDIMNYEENSGYLIRSLQGWLESFEREYYDLIRSAFLKYRCVLSFRFGISCQIHHSFQVRIGNMDGVIVAYHNTARIFGFQYIPLEEMDKCLFGASDRGERVFRKCLNLLEAVATEVTGQFPNQVSVSFLSVDAFTQSSVAVRTLYDRKAREQTGAASMGRAG